jgi:quercetin dioxygenase-like cupin family protein
MFMDRPAMHTVMSEREAQWGHYDDLPEGEFTLEDDDGDVPWSERLSRWWQISDLFDSETLSVTVIELEPGDSTPMHAHEPPVEEYYVVLKGTVDIDLQEETIEGATPGLIAYFPPGVEERLINRYETTSVQLGFRSLCGSIDDMHGNIDVR